MKRYLQLLFVILIPYWVVFVLICVFSGLIDTLNNSYLLLLLFPVLYFAALVSSVIVLIISLAKKWSAQEVLHISMIIKLIHIPAYVFIFIVGLGSSITIFTIGVSFILIILDIMTIFLSGLIGLGGVIRSVCENKLSKKTAVMHGIFQFIFCADVISSIIIYKKVKSLK